MFKYCKFLILLISFLVFMGPVFAEASGNYFEIPYESRRDDWKKDPKGPMNRFLERLNKSGAKAGDILEVNPIVLPRVCDFDKFIYVFEVELVGKFAVCAYTGSFRPEMEIE